MLFRSWGVLALPYGNPGSGGGAPTLVAVAVAVPGGRVYTRQPATATATAERTTPPGQRSVLRVKRSASAGTW